MTAELGEVARNRAGRSLSQLREAPAMVQPEHLAHLGE